MYTLYTSRSLSVIIEHGFRFLIHTVFTSLKSWSNVLSTVYINRNLENLISEGIRQRQQCCFLELNSSLLRIQENKR
jgi:hypothetical protein